MESRIATLSHLCVELEQASRPVGLSHQRFDEAHELFERSSNQQQLILEWLSDLIQSHCATQPTSRILSVGCGSGILDNPLIESIATTLQRIEYTGVDPNTVACRRFQDEFDDLAFPHVQLDLREEGIESLTSVDRFDVIHVIHSLYYFNDPAETLDRLLGLLAPDGKVVIVQAPEAELNQLASCFWRHYEESSIWFSDCLADHLSTSQFAFARHRIHGEVDVKRCFEADCADGEMMLDFITQSDCRKLGDDIIELSLGYLRDISRPHNGSVLVAHPADAFIIQQSSAPRCMPESAKA